MARRSDSAARCSYDSATILAHDDQLAPRSIRSETLVQVIDLAAIPDFDEPIAAHARTDLPLF